MKNAIRIIVITALIAGISACTPRETVELVVLGDAFGSNTIPKAYENVLKEDLDATVDTFVWSVPSTPLHSQLEALRKETELRQAIKAADAIMVGITPKWNDAAENLYMSDMCRGNDNQDCLRDSLARAKRDWMGFVHQLAELREGKPVILLVIRWGDWLYPAYYGDNITPEQTALLSSYFNEFQSFQASTPGVKSTIVFPQDYDQIPKEYLQEDGLHLSDKGSAVAVDLLRALGYESAVLEGIADLTITFTETGCASTPLEGEISNPIYIRVDNPTDGNNALVIFTVEEGYGAQDILDFKGNGLPGFSDEFVAHLTPGMSAGDLYETTLIDDRENYLVCAQDGVGALAVPLVLKP